ncbi:hypothetical protein KJZ61_01055 [Candidatus Dependentiae bacterium]|nr:hypothetical protein [Candidatus Dependentiae bacterium]
MNKRVLKVAALVSIVTCGALRATTELRTPLSVVKDFGPFHYRLEPVNPDDCWSWDVFGALYQRRADKAFSNARKADGSQKFSTRDTVSLAEAFFGQETFTGIDAFAHIAGEACPVVVGNPFMSFAKISPVFHYTERGFVAGAHVEYDFGDCSNWYVGARAVLPFKNIRVDRDLSCNKLEEGLEDVMLQVLQRVDPTIEVEGGTNLTNVNPLLNTTVVAGGAEVNNPDANIRSVYAYRLDFLTALRMPGTPNSVVKYTPANIEIAGIDVTVVPGQIPEEKTAFFLTGQVNPPQPLVGDNYSFTIAYPQNATRHVYALRSTDGTLASVQSEIFDNTTGEVRIAQDVEHDALVAANGSGGANGARLAFEENVDYLPLAGNCDAQSELFIIPNSRGTGEVMPDGAAIGATIDYIIKSSLSSFNTSALGFLESKGIDLCHNQRVSGFGDLDTDLYLGYDFTECFYGEFAVGARWPTGKKMKDAGLVYYQPTGNNGHFELKAQGDLGWQPTHWAGLHVNASYSHVFSRTEKKAAAFKGATVKNIGPSIDAKVSYGYFVGHFDVTLFHPENCNLGLAVGYELYAKRKDKVTFATAMAKDLNGDLKPLDETILEKDTNAVSHKIRGEMFHRWNYCELFIGASRAFAGRSVLKETEAHVGIGIYF